MSTTPELSRGPASPRGDDTPHRGQAGRASRHSFSCSTAPPLPVGVGGAQYVQGSSSTLRYALGVVERLQTQIYTIKAEKDKAEERCHVLESEAAAATQQLEALERERVAERADRDMLVKRFELLVEELQGRVRRTSADLQQEADAHQSTRLKLASSEAEISSLQERIRAVQMTETDVKARLQHDLAILRERLKAVDGEQDRVHEELKQERRRVSQLKDDIAEKDREIRRLKDDCEGKGNGAEKAAEGPMDVSAMCAALAVGGRDAEPSALLQLLVNADRFPKATLKALIIKQAERLRTTEKVVRVLKKALTKTKEEVRALEKKVEERNARIREFKQAEAEFFAELKAFRAVHDEMTARGSHRQPTCRPSNRDFDDEYDAGMWDYESADQHGGESDSGGSASTGSSEKSLAHWARRLSQNQRSRSSRHIASEVNPEVEGKQQEIESPWDGAHKHVCRSPDVRKGPRHKMSEKRSHGARTRAWELEFYPDICLPLQIQSPYVIRDMSRTEKSAVAGGTLGRGVDSTA